MFKSNLPLTHTGDEVLDIVQDDELQLSIYDSIVDQETPPPNVWDKSVKVEENSYYWKGLPIIRSGHLSGEDKPLVVELFCGCGGTSLGFEMAGFELAVGCDIHQPSIKTFQTNHPNASTILGDVKKLTRDLNIFWVGKK